MGRLNHVSQMTPFRNGFRHNLNKELKKAEENIPNKIKLSSSSQKDLRCGIIGLDEKGYSILAHQIFWPREFIEKGKDKKGARFGDKTCTLAAIGVILPFLLIPEKLKNQHIICGVDCMGVVYSWENKKKGTLARHF
jgi:hypothetical protein